ncbi:unnamed protein product (macronuclear) [Paramecium tetraurelia]|uniref:Uncharacterized protein n=1 Tax=Paramecium tetraurelia TaxID=5888 RepID=A0C5P8_PARTE|nr:uncharacterized protein GSPATT00035244001 [Paramecium tetraurelia]CAK66115.1 unnamed protein product [Paramecium tetraurelia]|eukprot:XP_001433512.1 hypothetical protein (macronuclear) [Paramecium tetraurelia strain d4-2]
MNSPQSFLELLINLTLLLFQQQQLLLLLLSQLILPLTLLNLQLVLSSTQQFIPTSSEVTQSISRTSHPIPLITPPILQSAKSIASMIANLNSPAIEIQECHPTQMKHTQHLN